MELSNKNSMTMKSVQANGDLEYLFARLDEVRMSEHERLRAKASLAKAEAAIDTIIAAADAIHGLLQATVIGPFRRLAKELG